MKKNQFLIGAALAGLTMTLSACPEQAAQANEGQCHGVNSCKGQGECSGVGHDCGGHNECKGQGWTKTTTEACAEQNGEFKPLDHKPEATDATHTESTDTTTPESTDTTTTEAPPAGH